METFRKDDNGKLMFSLIEPEFLEGIAKVLTDASYVYGANNWKTINPDELTRYKDALLRHVNSYMKGENIDSDSGHHHMLHIACNAMFLHWFNKESK